MDQTPANSVDTTNVRPLNTKQFNDKYWFNSLQMIEVLNPAWYPESPGHFVDRDYPFMVEMRHFIIKAGQTEKFPGVIANVYLDQMSKIMAQNDDKLSYMTDPELRKIYYDNLIVSVTSLVQEQFNGPEYLKNVAPSAFVSAPDETPPWQENMERARDVATMPPQTIPDKPEPKAPEPAPKPIDKSFEYEGAKYKLTIDIKGVKHYFKNGIMTTAAEYNRVASML